MESLRGRLLIASPGLFDYFRRSVVLVVEHTPDGAFGVVLNRRADHQVAELVPELGPLVERDAPLWLGGPVAEDSIVVLGEFEQPEDAAGRIGQGVGLVDPESDSELLRARVFVGHAGWGPGQLDEEIERDSWIVTEFGADDVFAAGDLWAEVLRRLGGDMKLLATMPDDPSLN
ncbi:MAG: YqgE/AlgH family protein [Solirubrobacterales bacterium]|nr:YqgE/AlgH family protein [Solirubrobacterales bacterium]